MCVRECLHVRVLVGARVGACGCGSACGHTYLRAGVLGCACACVCAWGEGVRGARAYACEYASARV